MTSLSVVAGDGAVLRGWYAQPSTYNGNSVLLLHGVGDNREGMAGYAELFLGKGYAVLLPDSRAHGESGGQLVTYGLLESDDVYRWVEWLRTQSNPSCVYGLGESMGAAIVLQSLKTRPGFCAVVAESPFSTFREVAFDRVGYYIGLGQWCGRTIARLPVDLALAYVRLRYKVNLLNANPEDAVRESNTPVLLIHGESDRNILPWHSRELASADSNATLWLVPHAHHTGAWSTDPAECEQRVLTFLSIHSRATSPSTLSATP
ncbi:MAG TPA: alpha/beta fold hydrolase [Terriglobales bacterium]|nr:alpha/beta fold hydrolase [Terriglobales bacterium]